MKQTFLNTPDDVNWLLATALKFSQRNNALPFIPQSFCMMGNEDCPQEILLYRLPHPSVTDKPVCARLMGNGSYSFFQL